MKDFFSKQRTLTDFSKSKIDNNLSSINGGDNSVLSFFIIIGDNIIITEDIVDLKTTENYHLTIV